MKPAIGEVWHHYKTKGLYEIVGLGQIQVKTPDLDEEECVIYKAVSDGNIWIRPLSDFLEAVSYEGTTVSRFSKE